MFNAIVVNVFVRFGNVQAVANVFVVHEFLVQFRKVVARYARTKMMLVVKIDVLRGEEQTNKPVVRGCSGLHGMVIAFNARMLRYASQAIRYLCPSSKRNNPIQQQPHAVIEINEGRKNNQIKRDACERIPKWRRFFFSLHVFT